MDQPAPPLPPQVLNLAERERQIASLIYLRGATTAKQLEELVEPKLSNGAVRSMLVRLVRKGILRRDWGKRGRGQQFIYMPVITSVEVKHRAIRQLSERYFDGSLLKVLVELVDVLDAREVLGATERLNGNPGLGLAA
jgi:predicted transcriptional regulator